MIDNIRITFNYLSIFCHFLDSTQQVDCVRIQSNSSVWNQQIIFFPYDRHFNKKRDVTLTYSSQFCEILKLTVKGIIYYIHHANFLVAIIL